MDVQSTKDEIYFRGEFNKFIGKPRNNREDIEDKFDDSAWCLLQNMLVSAAAVAGRTLTDKFNVHHMFAKRKWP